MLNKLIFTLLLVLLVTVTNGQDSTSHRISVSAGINRGFIIAHRPLIVPLQKDHINGIEANLVLRPDGSRPWHRIYGLPEIGMSLCVWDLGNRNQLGSAISLIPFIDFPLVKGAGRYFASCNFLCKNRV